MIGILQFAAVSLVDCRGALLHCDRTIGIKDDLPLLNGFNGWSKHVPFGIL